jgi:2-phospho-L-lactate guanylyltransferase (CobY/MobA/RfbA family)
VADWTVVIPVKGTASAKSRLGASAELALAIALDTVAAALVAARVVVVTSSSIASQFEEVGAAGDGAVAVLLGDVPALRPDELAAALELAAQHPLAFVADADKDGTVLITALRAVDHRPAFGAHSRASHLAAGYVELDVPLDSGLRRDVDTAEQLAALAPRVGPHTRALL